jgi:hypothetical protein
MQSIRQILLISLLSFIFATSFDNIVNGEVVDEELVQKKKNLRHQQVIRWDDSIHEYSYGNETKVSPPPSVSPSSNATTISPSPSIAPSPAPSTATPTTSPPTTAPPTTSPPTPSPTQHHPRREWWRNFGKFLLKAVCWIFIVGLFFFAFGAVMSNRYRIYYYLRDAWYSLLRKLKWKQSDGSAPSAILNDIIFSDNDLQEGLLGRAT